VAEGIGYTVLPWAAVYDDVRSRRLKVVSISGQGFTRTVTLHVPYSVADARD
jgi:hypothetical protein